MIGMIGTRYFPRWNGLTRVNQGPIQDLIMGVPNYGGILQRGNGIQKGKGKILLGGSHLSELQGNGNASEY